MAKKSLYHIIILSPLLIGQFLLFGQSTESFLLDPTSFQLGQMADPGEGIELIAPPDANNQGSAILHFPIKVPPGRQDLAPDLQIQYESGSGNGWLGLGWKLSLPSIDIETRWGVPKFDPLLESETYLLNGEQLTPVAHRTKEVARTSEKIFHQRVEGDFLTIIRHGTSPNNYWWEITDKEGNIFSYGGRKKDGPLLSSVLKDDRGNVARWALAEIRDANNNFMRFHCTIVSDPGVIGGTVMGRQLYPSSISYTGHNDIEGPFTVRFIRDRALGEIKRFDIEINGRLGFKEVHPDLLRKIEITFHDEIIRSYDLIYQQGAFSKTLLASISEYDQEGELFYTHTFDYHDDVRENGTYVPFGTAESWNVPYDEIRGDIINPIPGFDGETSVLGGGKSNNIGGGSVITVGPYGDPASKMNSAGGSFSYAVSDAQGLMALVDMDGDGLPDKVFNENGRLVFRKNLSKGENTQVGFGDKITIKGISQFDVSKTTSISAGAEGHAGIAFVGYENTTSNTTSDTYFSDFNGDGLIDIVSRGKVYFNFINSEGHPEFTPSSGHTESPINASGTIDPALIEIDPLEQEKLIEDFPLHDVVKMWEAPYSGMIQVDAPVQLIQNPQADNYPQKDGVRVVIQFKSVELWSTRIAGNDYAVKRPILGQHPVAKGDRIYFRVQSVLDGAFDEVAWDPIIKYMNATTDTLTADCRSLVTYQASEDYLLNSVQSLFMPVNGSITIAGKFEKQHTSDDIRLKITSLENGNSTTIFNQLFAHDSVIETSIDLADINVRKGDEFLFEISASSQIDWTAIAWLPNLFYTSSPDQQVMGSDGSPLLQFCPSVAYSMYNNTLKRSSYWISPEDNPALSLSVINLSVPDTINGTITLTAKRKLELVGKISSYCNLGQLSDPLNLQISVTRGDTIWFDLSSQTPEIGDSLIAASLRINLSGGAITIRPGVHASNLENEMLFGPLYRGWGHFAYLANRGKAFLPINESELMLDTTMAAIDPDEIDLDDPDALDGMFDPKSTQFIIFYADVKSQAWLGFDDLTYVTNHTISSSRLGDDDIAPAVPRPSTGDALSAPGRKFRTVMESVAGGVSAGPVSGTGGTSWSDSEILLDLLDFNGDQYPDIVTSNGIQYSTPRGGWNPTATMHGLGPHQATSNALGGTLGGGFIFSSTSNSGEARANSSRSVKAKSRSGQSSRRSRSAAKTAAESVGISGNLTEDKDRAKESWIDLNGDGLIDKVYADGRASLNLGYRFASAEPWGFSSIRGGRSLDYGAGAGINYQNGSIMAGLSLSRTDIITENGLEDVNGDGLVDWILERDPFTVRINTGSGFAPAIIWKGISAWSESTATGESANVGFTFCIPIPIIGIRICVNPNGFTGQGVSRNHQELQDIDGDGYQDHLEARENDGNLTVRRSTIRRTNLLKSVRNPLGGSFLLDYTTVGNTYSLPHNQWVLSSVAFSDGLANDGADTIKNKLIYQKGYFDRHERTFYGFGEVIEHQLDTENKDAIYRTTVSTYDVNSYYRKNLITSITLLDAEQNKFVETLYDYEVRDINSGLSVGLPLEQSEILSLFPALVTKRVNHYEGTQSVGLQERVEFNYDLLGNIIETVDYGDGSLLDKLTTMVSYHDFAETNIKSIPKSIRSSDQKGWLRLTERDIDVAGKVLEERSYLDDQTFTQVNYSYDIYGNILSVTNPPNENGERLETSYAYDELTHSYVASVVDGYGYQSSSHYDTRYGALLKSTDINGHSVISTLDSKGRLSTVLAPIDSANNQAYTLKYEYHPLAESAHATVRHNLPDQEDDYLTINFVDGLGRSVQSKNSLLFFQGTGLAAIPVMQVSGPDFYDAFGRVVKEYYPTVEALGQETILNTELNPIPPSLYHHDILDRDTKTILPDGATTTLVYKIIEGLENTNQLRTRITDSEGNLKDSYWDVRDRQRATVDHGPNGEIWTTFYYNAISELIATEDDFGLTNSSSFDKLGRKVRVAHPDKGITEYQYDLASNLISEITPNIRKTIPNGGAIRYAYDKERVVAVTYPKNIQNNVRFYYGQPGDINNRAGRIWLVEDASGGTEYDYNALGAIQKEIRTLIINLTNISSFVSTMKFDSWNRPLQMTYPDNEEVTYHYNAAGSINQLTGLKEGIEYTYIDQVGYDAFGDRVLIAYGNGSNNITEYDPHRRTIKRSAAKSRERLFMDKQYQYDQESNLLSMQNNVAGTENLIGGTSQFKYQYDQLYRLTEADGEWKGKEKSRNFSLEMTYDNVHGIQQKQQEVTDGGKSIASQSLLWNYSYENRHAPEKIADRTYIYDANGNILSQESKTTFDNHQMVWDEENRMMGISENGYISQYTYDASGNRSIKSHGGAQGIFLDGAAAGAINHINNYTAYVSKYLTVEENKFTKHYFIDNERILSKIGTGKFNHNLLPTYKGLFAGNIDYQNRLQQLGQTLHDYYAQLGIPPGPPTLPGYYAQPEITGDPLPGTPASNPFTTPPVNWSLPIGPPDTLGPPGTPIWLAVEDTMLAKPGYGFEGALAFPEINAFFYHGDHLGSSAYLTNYSGGVRQHIEYLPFGEPLIQENLDGENTPYLFTGKEYDAESGLFYFGDRFYDPKTSMWQSVDPEADAYPTISPYAYVANNPNRFVDRDGRKIDYRANNSRAFQQDVRRAFSYLKNSPSASKLLKQVSGLNKVVTIRKAENISEVEFDPGSLTVYWHPRSGLKVRSGGKQTPALGLAHELQHALEHGIDARQEKTDYSKKYGHAHPRRSYDNRAEYKVIRGAEKNIADELGEPTRRDHRGTEFRTTGPATTETPAQRNRKKINRKFQMRPGAKTSSKATNRKYRIHMT